MVRVVALTCAGAALVCATYRDQRLAAVLLFCALCAYLGRQWWKRRKPREALSLAFVATTTGVIGFLTESWGTMHGHWTYHGLPAGQFVPLWVPLAWSAAGELLHRLDRAMPASLPVGRRVGVAALLGMALPLLGESICIAYGVWTYHWPYQILGVPIAALVLISYAHATFTCIRAGTDTFAGDSNRQLARARDG